jgi:hypothetical protein
VRAWLAAQSERDRLEAEATDAIYLARAQVQAAETALSQARIAPRLPHQSDAERARATAAVPRAEQALEQARAELQALEQPAPSAEE